MRMKVIERAKYRFGCGGHNGLSILTLQLLWRFGTCQSIRKLVLICVMGSIVVGNNGHNGFDLWSLLNCSIVSVSGVKINSFSSNKGRTCLVKNIWGHISVYKCKIYLDTNPLVPCKSYWYIFSFAKTDCTEVINNNIAALGVSAVQCGHA